MLQECCFQREQQQGRLKKYIEWVAPPENLAVWGFESLFN